MAVKLSYQTESQTRKAEQQLVGKGNKTNVDGIINSNGVFEFLKQIFSQVLPTNAKDFFFFVSLSAGWWTLTRGPALRNSSYSTSSSALQDVHDFYLNIISSSSSRPYFLLNVNGTLSLKPCSNIKQNINIYISIFLKISYLESF